MSSNPLGQKDKSSSKLSHELTIFADSLKPSESYINEGKKLVQDVFTRFQQEDKFSISRSFFGGSVGKQTSVIYPDYDCVIFLNKKLPPMLDSVKDFVDLLTKEAKTLKIVPDSISNSKITAQMRFSNGAELDLLPACSFNNDDADKQYEEVIKRIKENPTSLQDYSSSLAETVIKFLKSQQGPTHQLIRLAKYWYKSLTLDGYVYGGSTTIEIICVAAVYDVCNEGNGYYATKAFRKFLEKIQEIDKQKIAFYRDGENWTLVPERDFVQKKYKNYYPPEILKRNNFIIEPANPYNDLAQNLKPAVTDKLKHYAKKMLDRLNDLEKQESSAMKTLRTDGSIVIHIEKFFEPFPLRLRGSYSHAGIPVYLLIHYDYQNYETAHCRTEENNKSFFTKTPEARKATKALRNNLLFLIRAKAHKDQKNYLQFTDGLAEMARKEDVKAAMQIIIDQNFGVKQFIKESNANKEHKSYDATVYVPYRCDGRTYAVRLSLKWEH